MSYNIKIKIEGEWKEYPLMREGFSLSYKVGEKGKHVTQSCSCKVLSKELFSIIFKSSVVLDAQIVNGNALMFTGVIRPYATAEALNDVLKPISLSILDNTERLHKKAFTKVGSVVMGPEMVEAQTLNGLKVIGSSAADSILHKICELCNVKIASAPYIGTILPRFKIAHGDYLDALLADVLFCYGYDYTFDKSGSLVVFSTDPSADSIGHINTMKNTLNITRSDSQKDGVAIFYRRYQTASHNRIFSGEWDSGYSGTVFGYKGTHGYAPGQNVRHTWDKSSFLSDGKSEPILSNFSVETWNTGTGGFDRIGHFRDMDNDGGYAWVEYWGWYGWTMFGSTAGVGLAVYADVSYLEDKEVSVGQAGRETESYSARYIYSDSLAVALYKTQLSRLKHSNYTFSFESFGDYAPGAFYDLNENAVTGVTTKVRILSKTIKNDYGLYAYQAESCEAVSISIPENPELPEEKPEDNMEFFNLKCSKSTWLVEELDSKIICEAYGEAFERYGCTPSWRFNDVPVSTDSPCIFVFDKSSLDVGMNFITCAIIYEGDLISRQISLTLVKADAYSEFEYCVTDSPDQDPILLETYFKYGDYYIAYGDHRIVVDDIWTKDQPIPKPGQYVWMRMKNKAGEWVSIRMTGVEGEPARSWTAAFSPSAYVNSPRRQENLYISINCNFQNIPEPHLVSYEFVGEHIGSLFDEDQSNVIVILPGAQPASLTVKVTLGGLYGGEKILKIYGTEATDSAPMYIGTTDVMPPNITKYGAILDGDWTLYLGPSTDTYIQGHVYEKKGSIWEETTSMSKLPAVQEDAIQYASETNNVVFARTVYAENILATYIHFSGALFSGAYDKDGQKIGEGPGVHISNNGLIQAQKAILDSAEVTGSFTSDEFSTRQENKTFNINAAYAKNGFYILDFLAYLEKNANSGNVLITENIQYVKTQCVGSIIGLKFNYFCYPTSIPRGMYPWGYFIKNSQLFYTYNNGSSLPSDIDFHCVMGGDNNENLPTGVFETYATLYNGTAANIGKTIMIGEAINSLFDDIISGPAFPFIGNMDFNYVSGYDSNGAEITRMVSISSSNASGRVPYKLVYNPYTHVLTIYNRDMSVAANISRNTVIKTIRLFSIQVITSLPGIDVMNIVPIENGVHSIGSADKHFGFAYIDNIFYKNISRID